MSKKKNALTETSAPTGAAKAEKATKSPKTKATKSAEIAGTQKKSAEAASSLGEGTVAAKNTKPAAKVPASTKSAAAEPQPSKAAATAEAPDAQKRSRAAAGNGSGKETSAPVLPISQDEVAKLAYSYAESRGFHGGSPEEDWHRAELELRRLRGLA